MGKVHITGGAGFIGSNLVRVLNAAGITPIVYDNLDEQKWKNLSGLSFVLRYWQDLYDKNCEIPIQPEGDVLVHLAANVDTTEKFNDKLWANNFIWPLEIFPKFTKVIYASSGSVYGAEEKDFSERIYGLKQLNAYGFSKWALDEAIFGMNPRIEVENIYALRFFNVYGPNETHKGGMQSVVSKAINRVKPMYGGTYSHTLTPIYNLFKSDRPEVKDGEQKRDFIFVDDVAKVILHFIVGDAASGIYNLGSGQARSFNDLIRAIDPTAIINYAFMPDVLKRSYQYFTQADLTKLRSTGYVAPMTSLEEGIRQTLALTFPKSPHTL